MGATKSRMLNQMRLKRLSLTLLALVLARADNTCTTQPAERGPSPIKGHVISCNEARWTATAAHLRAYNITPVKVACVPLDHDVIRLHPLVALRPESAEQHAKFLSLTLSHRKAVLEVAFDSPDETPLQASDEWGLIFEDDVAFHESLSPLQFHSLLNEAMALSKESGFFYLGLCGPRCMPEEGQKLLRRCVGACAHAYALSKRRALWFYQEAMNALVTSSPDERDKVGSIHADIILAKLFESRYAAGVPLPYLVGAGLHQPGTHPTHFGAVYQDRRQFGSELAPGAYAQYE